VDLPGAADTGVTGVEKITYAATGAQNLPGTDAPGALTTIGISANGVTTLSYFATDNGNNVESPHTLTIKLDKEAPDITISSPAAGTPAYLINQVVTAIYTCSDNFSGLSSCTSSQPSGSPLATSAVGTRSITVAATDIAGNSNGSTAAYDVTYAICSLYDPTKAAKSGATLPIRLQLCDVNGTNTSSASVVLTVTGVQQVSTSASNLLEDSLSTTADSTFRFDPNLGSTGGYVLNLSTKGLTTGTYQLLFMAAGDSISHKVPFQVR